MGIIEKDINTSTGMYQFRKGQPKMGLIFSDNTCPICGEKLRLLVKYISDIPFAVRYQCDSCGYICPIKYNINGHKCTKTECSEPLPNPTYDESIYEFREQFGE